MNVIKYDKCEFDGERCILTLNGEEAETISLDDLVDEYMELMEKNARIKYERV